MTGIIYLITNTVNGKQYVGQTSKTLIKRWSEHKADAKRGKITLFLHALRKYGPDVMDLEELCTLPVEWLPAVECAFIYALKTQIVGYNMTEGGEGTPGAVRSEESRIRYSESKRGEKHPFFGKGYLMKGRKISLVAKEKMSKAKKGIKQTAQHVAAATQSRIGGKRKSASSKFHGVSYDRRTRWWCSEVRGVKGGKRLFFKRLPTELEAASYYNEKVIELNLCGKFPLNTLSKERSV